MARPRALRTLWLSIVVPLLAYGYRLYYATLRIRLLTPERESSRLQTYQFHPEIVALCERDVLAVAGAVAGRGFMMLVAHGRDGDWAAAALRAIGCRVVRGSSGRGGVRALITLIRDLADSGGSAAVVVDGPLGPPGQAKAGILLCSEKTGRPVRALGAAARRALVFKHTWSGIYLPWPFSTVAIVCDAPVPVRGGGSAVREAAIGDLTRRLAEMRRQALDALAQ